MKQSTTFAQVATNQFDYLLSDLCANTPPCKKHSSSRKFLTLSISLRLLLVMLLTLTASTAWAETYTHSFNTTGTVSVSNNSVTLSNVTWSVATTIGKGSPTYTSITKGYSYCGWQFGSSKDKYYSKVILSTNAFSSYNVQSVVLNMRLNGGVSTTMTVKQGSTTIGTATMSTANVWTDLVANSTKGTGGDLSITIATTQAFYIHSITVTYEDAVPSCSIKPTVGTTLQSVTATENSIKATISISSIGGCNITENGLVYSTTNSTPTVGGSGCTKVTTTACGSTAANKTVTITGLTCGQSYYIRGYATNEAGTSYTNVTTKSTSDCPKYTVTLMDDTDNPLSQTSAGGTVTLPKRDGCTGYTFAGWTKSWSVDQTTWTTTAPTIIPAGSYTPTANESLYPVYTKTEGGGSEPTAYSAGDVGSFIIASNVSDKWYAIPENPTLSSDKITGVEITVSQTAGGVKYVSTANAKGYTWKIANATNGQTISDGSQYIYHSNGGASGTKLTYGASTSYTWKIEKETNGLTFKGMNGSTTNSRGLLFNGSVFGGYALSNEDESGYYRIQVLPIGGGSTTYYISVPDCTTKTSVTLNPNGGTISTGDWAQNGTKYTQTVETTNDFTLPTPTKTGYAFGGWYESSTFSGSAVTEIEAGTTGTKEFWAKWTAEQYTVQLDNQEATTAGATSVTATYNAAMPSIASNLPQKTGSTFLGYFTATSGGTKYYNADGTSAKNWDKTSDATLYAQWECVTPTISTQPQSATYLRDDDADALSVVAAASDATLTYQWQKSTDNSTWSDITGATEVTYKPSTQSVGTTYYRVVVTNSDGNCSATSDVVTIAVRSANCKWVEADIANINSGDEVVVTMMKEGYTWALSQTMYNSTGYPLATHIEGITNGVIPKNQISEEIKWNISGNATDGYILYPNSSTTTWLYFTKSSNIVKVGTGADNVFTINNGYLYHINTTDSWAGYLGVSISTSSWRHYPTTTGTSVIADQTLKFYKKECLPIGQYWINYELTDVVCTDNPLKNKISTDDNAVELNFEATGEHNELPTTIIVTNGSTTLTVNTDYTWNNATGVLTLNPSQITDNITISIAAQKRKYTVTFDANGHGTAPAVQSVTAEETASEPTDPEATGYTFGGWYKEPQCTTAFDFATPITGNITLYAKWTVNSYTVTWNPNGGNWGGSTDSKKDTYNYGATITKPVDPTRDGYRFDGWGDVAGTMPANNLEYTAQWTKVYKITWYENGVPSYTYVPSDNPIVTWEDNIADCGEKKFYGWTADDTFVSDPTIPPTLISKGTTIAGDVTYYAVYADAEEPANPGYTKVTTISEGTYLIATGETSSNKAYTGKYPDKTYGGTCDVTVNNQVISTKPTSAVEVEVTLGTGANSGKFAIYDGTYYLSAPTSNDLTFNNSVVYDWKLTSEGYINSTSQTSRYIQLNSSANPNRFACYTGTQKYAYLYKKQTTTYKNFAVSCATYTITVTPPTGGTVTTNPTDEAGAGQEITINVTPADCKYLTALKYNDGSDHSINIASAPYTFTMPAADVTITATFADKTATDIEVITSAHRLLMQGSAFVGEQVRITYNNGDKETLNWNDSRLTFTGHNTATWGSQTVTVTYNDCGTQSASYNIEVIDGLGITFWDGNYTEVVKYEPGDLVDVDSRIGQNICSGWEFAGWSETKVANESEEYVPVHNFNATDAKVLYAVYVKKKAQWTTIVTADEAKSGAKYVLAYDRYDTYYALTSSVKDVNYLAGKVVTSTEGELNSFDVYYLSAEPTADLIWELVSTGENGKWYLYNKNTAKYIDLSTQGQIHLTDLPSDKLQMESGYNDSQIRIASSTVPTYYLSWDNSNTRYNTYASSNSQEYWYTKDEEFTSTPPCSPLSATFHGNGGIVTDGVNSGDDLTITEPTRDAGITTPTASFADCNGKSWTFVGWSDKEVDVTRVPVLTTDLLHDGGGNKPYKIQEDGEEFWAVYTNQGNPETKYGTITFAKENFPNTYDNISKSCTIVENGDSYNFYYTNVAKPSGNSIQIQEGKGYLTNTTSLGKINSISFTNFIYGNINCLKVSLGTSADALTTVLTAEELQVVDGVYTYYPKANYSFFKIESIEDAGAVGIETISIDFGKGTQIWATTPDCSIIRILTDEEVYVTATKDRGIMSTAPLTIKTQQLEANADVVITSTSSDVYFSATRDANFAKAAANQPKTSLTLNADADGNLQQDIYVHYKPSAEGNGTPASVVVSANLATPNPSVTDDQTIHVRNLPAKFVIATKVGATWYALPANMSEATNPEGVLIEVDEASMTATAPNTASYTLFPVKTTNGEYDRYATNTSHYEGNAYGDRVRFAAVNNNNGLWANNNENGNTIRNYAAISSVSDGETTSNTNPSYEWKITTTVVDGNWQYTLQTDQDKNQQYLRYWIGATGAPKWGTYAAGNNQLYFLPVTETEPFDYKVVEWYPTKMLIQTDATIANPTAEIGDAPINNVTCTNKGSKLYEIAGLPLESNPTKVLTIKFSDGGNNYTNATAIPVIISQSATTVSSAPFTTLTKDVYNYADLVVRDGATLTIDGETHAENTFFNVTIYPTSKISVPNDKKLTVHSLTFFGGIDEIYNGSTYTLNKYGVPELSLKGTLYKSIAKMDYLMRVDLDQMYSLTVPYDVQLADIKYWDGSDIALGSALYVSAYDGEARANQSKKTWIYETDFNPATLKAGVGYTISAELQNGVGSKYSILRMPMMSNVENDATEAAKTVAVTAWGKDANVTDNHKGWNLVGNPYMTTIQGADDADLVLGYLKETGTGPWEWVEKTYRYVTIPSDDGTYYWQQKFTTAELPPFKNFFVQIGTTGELQFGLGTRQSMPARSTQAAIEKEVEFEILMSNDARQDNTGLLISEEYSPAYEINADLEKMIGSMSVYTIYGGYKLAYNALSPINASEWIPMGYIAPAAGEYTFRLDDVENIAEQVEHVYIIDYNANNIVDLMDEEYKFTTDKEQNDNRFAINVVLSQDKDNTTTGMDIINGNVAAPIKFIYHDKMYIQSGGVIYDGTGKQVTNINK